MFEYKGLKFTWLGHACFKIKNGGKTIYFDPYELRDGEQADIVFVTHSHFDHLSLDDLSKIVSEKTVVVVSEEGKAQLAKLKLKEVKSVKPGDTLTVEGIEVATVPAYNINKFKAPGQPFHPKEEGMVGYIIKVENVKVYHAGDTDKIAEMEGLNPDVALIPVSGTYVMTAEEAAEAVKLIKPKVAIPMHYGAIVGSREDAEKFKQLVKDVQVVILEKEA
jgi:L-ascorbate metabolism protein UlaG (beta-lactamase superfamily)